MESEGDRDGVGDRQRQERKEGRSYHDRANENKKPTAPAVNSSYKRDDKGPNALKPPFCPAVNVNYQNHPSADKSGNPICY